MCQPERSSGVIRWRFNLGAGEKWLLTSSTIAYDSFGVCKQRSKESDAVSTVITMAESRKGFRIGRLRHLTSRLFATIAPQDQRLAACVVTTEDKKQLQWPGALLVSLCTLYIPSNHTYSHL